MYNVFYYHLQRLVLPVCSSTKVQGRSDLFFWKVYLSFCLSVQIISTFHYICFCSFINIQLNTWVPVWFPGAQYSHLSYILQQPLAITFNLLQFHLPFVSLRPALSLIL